MTVQLGLGLPQLKRFTPGKDVDSVARAAEQIGYRSLWVFERVLFPRNPAQGVYGVPGLAWPEEYRSVADPLVTLAYAAAATTRPLIATSILIAPLHGPFQLARHLATMDAATGGRVLAGFGTGWSIDEYAAAGAQFEQRGRALDELLDVCAAVWGPDPVHHEGEHSAVRDAEVGPKPARPIPVYLAGSAPKALERVARRADGWIEVGAPAQETGETWRRLLDRAVQFGRDPKDLELCVRANVRLTPAPLRGENRQPFTGTVEQVVRDVDAHVRIGAAHISLELQTNARDAEHLIELAAQLYGEIRAAGL